MRSILSLIAFAAALAALPYVPHAAQVRDSVGLAGIHKLHIENGLLCMADHFGQTGSWPTLEMAQARAVKSWAGFTRIEYGDEWADFEVAAGKSFDCRPAPTNRGPGYACEVKARPCRR